MRSPHLLSLFVAISLSAAAAEDRIIVSKDGTHFIHSNSEKPFHPWGFNYDRDHKMRLLEDYWQTEWPTVAADFAEMKRLGANVVRIHLQIAKFMDGPDKPNPTSLAQLTKLLALAQENNLRLDLTGLACYRRADVPAWYTELDQPARWQAQANFWSAIAQACAKSPAVFCYDLINEPSVPREPRKPNDWLTGDLAGLTYCQFITLDAKDRDRTQLAIDWTKKMSGAIRQHDPQTPITIGLLPFHKGTGFDVVALAPHLDFISVHFYPEKGKLDDQFKYLKNFSTTKPLIVEEIFPMKCSTTDLAAFMKSATPMVTGWLGFYWGPPLAELQKSNLPKDQLITAWLKLFETANPNQ